LAVIRRHIGPAPPHWLLTHVAERCATHPFDDGAPRDLRVDIKRLIALAKPSLDAEGQRLLHAHLAADRTLQLCTPYALAPLHADGWAPPTLALRVRQPPQPAAALLLRGRHSSPRGGPLRLCATDDEGRVHSLAVPRNGLFQWRLPLANRQPDARLVLHITSEDFFVPAECEPGAADTRALAYLLESLALVPAA
jgi:hypothetical protein